MNKENTKIKTLVILAALDTRGDEVNFLKEIIQARGHQVLTVDMGVMGAPLMEGDYTRERVAEAGGVCLEDLVEAARAGADRKKATDVMIAGAKKIVWELLSAGKLDGIMGLGGSTAAASGAAVMAGLPVGLPKLLVTTFINLAPVGEEDITVMQSPADLVGLNRIVAKTLANAAGAMAGMVEQEVPEGQSKKMVGITALGVTTPAVQKVIARLEEKGYDSVVFHATTEKMDRMIRGGVVDAVFDLTTFETLVKVCYTDDQISALAGSSGVDRSRLSGAVEKKVPQVIAPGGLDMHIFPGVTAIDQLPREYQGRAWSMHGPGIMLVRTNQDELEKVGRNIAERANRATGPVALVIPTGGFSEASKKDAPLYDPEADQAFVNALKRCIHPGIRVVEVDCHINDDLFADQVIKVFGEITSFGREENGC